MSEITNDNINKKNRLGRGLGSLLGGAQHMDNQASSSSTQPLASQKLPSNHAAMDIQPPVVSQKSMTSAAEVVPADARIWQVAIDKLTPGEFQPRSHFDKEKLSELSVSIKQNGILQPIVARKLLSGRYEIIAGERR